MCVCVVNSLTISQMVTEQGRNHLPILQTTELRPRHLQHKGKKHTPGWLGQLLGRYFLSWGLTRAVAGAGKDSWGIEGRSFLSHDGRGEGGYLYKPALAIVFSLAAGLPQAASGLFGHQVPSSVPSQVVGGISWVQDNRPGRQKGSDFPSHSGPCPLSLEAVGLCREASLRAEALGSGLEVPP